MIEVKDMSLVEFVDKGYLQELNRRFLHPLGLALEVVVDENLHPTHFGRVWDYRDDPEGMIYDSNLLDLEKAKCINRFARDRKPARLEAVGYWIQPVDES